MQPRIMSRFQLTGLCQFVEPRKAALDRLPPPAGYLHPIATPPAQTAPEPPARAAVLGIPLAVSDYEAVIDWMEAMASVGARGYVTAAAVNLVMSAHEDD